MKSIKVEVEAWDQLREFKTKHNLKNASECIKRALHLANLYVDEECQKPPDKSSAAPAKEEKAPPKVTVRDPHIDKALVKATDFKYLTGVSSESFDWLYETLCEGLKVSRLSPCILIAPSSPLCE